MILATRNDDEDEDHVVFLPPAGPTQADTSQFVSVFHQISFILKFIRKVVVFVARWKCRALQILLQFCLLS